MRVAEDGFDGAELGRSGGEPAGDEAGRVAVVDAADHAAAMTDGPELLASVGRPLPGVEVELRAPSCRRCP